MKKCPMCAEEIQDEAVKCKHCGEMLEEKPVQKWYYKTSMLVVAFLCVGPFAIPFVWMNPRYSTNKKIVLSVIMLLVSAYLGILAVNSLKSINDYYKTLLM